MRKHGDETVAGCSGQMKSIPRSIMIDGADHAEFETRSCRIGARWEICGSARVMVFGRGADSSDARHHIDAQRSAEIVLDLMCEDEIRLTTMQCAM